MYVLHSLRSSIIGGPNWAFQIKHLQISLSHDAKRAKRPLPKEARRCVKRTILLLARTSSTHTSHAKTSRISKSKVWIQKQMSNCFSSLSQHVFGLTYCSPIRLNRQRRLHGRGCVRFTLSSPSLNFYVSGR